MCTKIAIIKHCGCLDIKMLLTTMWGKKKKTFQNVSSLKMTFYQNQSDSGK